MSRWRVVALAAVMAFIGFGVAYAVTAPRHARLEGRESARDEDVAAMAWMGHPVPQDQMPGIARQDQIDQLTAAQGAAADALFVKLMTAHHEGGIHMAETAEEKASSARVRRLAHSMIQNQHSDLEELARLAPTG